MREGGNAQRVSVASVLAKYWWLALLVVATAIGLALFYSDSVPTEYEATAGLIVEDPRAPQLFEVTDLGRPSTQASERYLADQVEILRSAEAAALASESLDGRFSPNDILLRREITGDLTSNLINVRFSAGTPEDAKAGADALANAYQELRRRQIQDTAAVALAKVDVLVAGIEQDLVEIDRDIAATTSGSPALEELTRQFVEAQSEFNTLRLNRELYPVGSEQRDAINAQIAELLQDFATWEAALRIAERDTELGDLLAEKDAAIAEMAALTARANSIEVDAELAAGGVSLFSSAELPMEPSNLPTEIILVLATIVGLAAAFAIAYYLTLRRNVVERGRSASAVLDAPLLAEIPRFDLDGLKGTVPVVSAPTSSVSEAFRFAASLIDMRAVATDSVTLLVVGVTPEAGATAVVANAGSAAAALGLEVLLIDGDFGSQDLTRLLDGDLSHEGIAEIVDSMISADLAAQWLPLAQHVPVGPSRTLSLVSRGRGRFEPAAYMRSERTRSYFRAIRESYDLVLIDGPPLLSVAYGSTIANYADGVILVIEHGTKVTQLQEIKAHLDLIGARVFGYVYTKSPERRTVTDSELVPPADGRVPVDRLRGPNADADDSEPAVVERRS